jgi:flagellar hook assembly protein FlgD
VYPNPVHNQFCYELNLTQTTQVKVGLFDITGKVIETLIDIQLPAGAHNFTWIPKQKLANGIYYLRLDTENEQQSRKFVVMK